MGLFDKVEAKLERAVNGAFARAFKSEVQPVEIASAVRRAMDDRAAVAGKGRTFCPNIFQIELSPTDYDRLIPYEDGISDELIAAAEEHAESQRYTPGGPFQMILAESDELETGVFRVRPAKARRTTAGGYAAGAPQSAAPAPQAAPAPAAQPPVPHVAPMPAPGAPVRMDGRDLGSQALPAQPKQAAQAKQAAQPKRATHDPDVSWSLDDEYADDAALSPPPWSRGSNLADRPWLEIDGERYPLMGALTVLGRDDQADIILDDPGVSRRHAELRVTTDGPHTVVAVRDLGSTNGTFVNGERITSSHLTNGDQLTVGRTNMTLRTGR